MNTTATIGGSVSRRLLPAGFASLAIRAGRALERWGASRAAARPTQDELAQFHALRREARRAVADNESTMQRGTFTSLG